MFSFFKSKPSQNDQFLNLPDELILGILSNLSGKDIARFASTSTALFLKLNREFANEDIILKATMVQLSKKFNPKGTAHARLLIEQLENVDHKNKSALIELVATIAKYKIRAEVKANSQHFVDSCEQVKLKLLSCISNMPEETDSNSNTPPAVKRI